MTTPSISLPENFSIGYHKKKIASVTEPIQIREGNHFLLARNGRGKTTLLRTLGGSLDPIEGKATTQGQLQLIGERLRFDHYLPGQSILNALLPEKNHDKAEDLAIRSELDLRQPYGHYSTGNRQKLHLILAEFRFLESEPTILLLDEPFTGLDEPSRMTFLECWQQRRKNTLRLITIHPDYDGTELGNALLISNETIRTAHADEGHTWGTLKSALS